MANKTIGLVAKTTRTLAVELARELSKWCKAHDYELLVDEEVAPKLEDCNARSRAELMLECDPIVVLGGDGTLISVCHNPTPNPVTIIGVNVGTLGFLTEISPEEMLDTLEETLQGRSQVDERVLLHTKVERGGGELSSYYAFNDVVITKNAIARIFNTVVRVNGDFAASIRGDGVIVSTPSGSTAYSLSAGGSIVHPDVDALLITPICPHSVASRPLVIPGKSQIELSIDPELDRSEQVYFTVDGQAGMALGGGDKVSVTTSEKSCNFVRSASKTYFNVLGSKLRWAAPPE